MRRMRNNILCRARNRSPLLKGKFVINQMEIQENYDPEKKPEEGDDKRESPGKNTL